MHPNLQLLVHLCPAAEWEAARRVGELRPDSLEVVGFVHLSTPQQAHLPANRIFAGRADVLVLHIDPDRLDSPLRWEPGLPDDPAGMLFPHLYGPLPAGSVVAVSNYLPGSDGRFTPLEFVGPDSPVDQSR